MSREWIRIARSTGGELSTEQHADQVTAHIDWPWGARVSGDPAFDVEAAYDNLDLALMEDAAEEMVREGVV